MSKAPTGQVNEACSTDRSRSLAFGGALLYFIHSCQYSGVLVKFQIEENKMKYDVHY